MRPQLFFRINEPTEDIAEASKLMRLEVNCHKVYDKLG